MIDPLDPPPNHDPFDEGDPEPATPREWHPLPPPPPAPTLGTLGPPPLPYLEPIDALDEPPRRRSWLRWLLGWALKLVLGWVLLSLFMVTLYRFVPPPITLTMIGDLFAGHGVTQSWMPISRIDPDMARAAIAAEDSHFCQHHGFDWEALEKAYAHDQRGGRVRGGSTISQQTAKNIFLWQGGGYFRKALEAWFTVLIENIWGKRRIMEVYLNVAETGIGTYGVSAGSMRYFHHDASQLSPREAAQIAAVLPLPKKRAAIDPHGFTRRYGNAIDARIGVVRNDGLDGCLK